MRNLSRGSTSNPPGVIREANTHAPFEHRRSVDPPAMATRLAGFAGALPPAALELTPHPRAAPRLDGAKLPLELAIAPEPFGIELTGLERLPHRAVRLGPVSTVVEATLRRELRDVGESAVEVALPDLQLPKARRVHEQCPVPPDEELPMPGRVAAAAVPPQVAARDQRAPGEPG